MIYIYVNNESISNVIWIHISINLLPSNIPHSRFSPTNELTDKIFMNWQTLLLIRRTEKRETVVKIHTMLSTKSITIIICNEIYCVIFNPYRWLIRKSTETSAINRLPNIKYISKAYCILWINKHLIDDFKLIRLFNNLILQGLCFISLSLLFCSSVLLVDTGMLWETKSKVDVVFR